MRLKDYYRALGVSPSAGTEEIRKAFRRLALQHHPDRNPDSPFAAGRFRELQEAYQVLGDRDRRSRYDEERWLLGMSRRSPLAVTERTVLNDARRLRQHMERIDTYRMNHRALQEYVLLLLSDEHLSVMQAPAAKEELVRAVLESVSRLSPDFWPAVADRLELLAQEDPALRGRIAAARQLRRRREQEARLFPWIVLLIVALLLVIGGALLNVFK